MVDCPPEYQVYVKLKVRAQRAVLFHFVINFQCCRPKNGSQSQDSKILKYSSRRPLPGSKNPAVFHLYTFFLCAICNFFNKTSLLFSFGLIF